MERNGKRMSEVIKKQFCSIKDAADITGLSARFIRQHLAEIPHAKSGRKSLIYLDGLKEFALRTGRE
jgi:hypothetical protein